jgi:MerR family transcriptional regulator, copper efflux regulator
MLIRELASRTGLTIDTIRFYEKQGLLDESHFERSSNGYRHYSEPAIQRLKLIKLGQAAGFTLSEMRQSIRAWETDELTPQEKEFHLYRKLEDIERKINSLNEVRDYIRQKIEQMHVEPETIR